MKVRKIVSLFLMMIIGIPSGVFAVFGNSAGENCIFVSPSGNDGSDGSISSPLATLEAAKEKAKAMTGNITVYLREGSYTINETVVFSDGDRDNITFSAYNGEKVIITSGTPYRGFSECTVNGVRAFRKDVGAGADFNVLFSDKEKLRRTRFPESGYLYVKEARDGDVVNPESEETVHRGYRAMYAAAGDLKGIAVKSDMVVRILHYWKDEMLNIKSYDSSDGRMVFTRPSSMCVNEGDRYFIQNVFETLNEPGEWYLDRESGVLYYIPYENESAEETVLWGSETDTLISVNGVDGISFENIVFRGNGFTVPGGDGRRDFSQAAYDATSCLSYENASGFSVTNCEFRDIAACAVFMGKGISNACVENTYFENLGAQAVYIRGENTALDSPSVTRDISVTNNIISGYGREFFNAVGILVINANSVNVSDNEIHDGYYTAVSVGWVWGYAYNVTYNNRICNNLIYNIGQGWLSDMGGIYTLGNQPGTVISGNVIHNVAADSGQGGYGGWGIYLDEGSSYILVEKNLVYSCGSDGYHLHYGSYNTVRNNIFAFNGESQIRVVSNLGRVTPEDGGKKTADFVSNILLTKGKTCTFSHLTEKAAYSESGNIFWDITEGSDIYVSKSSAGKDAMSLETAERKGWVGKRFVFDPAFRNAEGFDFELAGDSPVFAAGFEAWDYSQAGTDKGTVVGLSAAGGSTEYNTASAFQQMTPSSERFHFLMTAVNRIIMFFRSLFQT